MAAAIYSTVNESGIDINNVFYLDSGTPEYPAPPFLPGTLAWGTDGSEWVYCTASLSIAKGKVVIVSETAGSWSVALIGGSSISTAPTGDLIGVVGGSLGSMSVSLPTGTQTGAYFWVQRAGNAPNVDTAASTTKNAQLYSSASVSGRLTSTGGAATSQYLVNGLVVSVATGSTTGPNQAVLNFPTAGIEN